jgi:FixJ family two-component response regulator
VVDDDVSMREALAGLIAANGLPVECYASAQEFLQRSPARVLPACLVLDVRMPDVGGLELQRELVDLDRDIPVIFITAHGDIPTAVRAMKAGAFEFLPKPFRSEELLLAIRQALERDRQARLQRAEIAQIRERRSRLTPREVEVMSGIVRGRLSKQIAAELGVSENTVKVHRSHVMQKMQATNLAALALMLERLV